MSLPAFTCNLSQFTLTSFTGSGPYTIATSLCFGHGFTGGSSGGDPTGRFAFSFFGNSPLVINSFTPDTVKVRPRVLDLRETQPAQAARLYLGNRILYSLPLLHPEGLVAPTPHPAGLPGKLVLHLPL
ncbi:hypothetical protein OAB01_02680 [Bacteroidia bacterium]|nr:hypothetical protein [Bacteroidia bacterium]